MKTHKLLFMALLGLLLWASCTQAEDSTDKQTESQEETSEEASEETTEEAEEEAEAPKKEKTTEIEEENNVMILHINNFERALSENQYLLVEFCKWDVLCSGKILFIMINELFCASLMPLITCDEFSLISLSSLRQFLLNLSCFYAQITSVTAKVGIRVT